jgi:hypothetical protein
MASGMPLMALMTDPVSLEVRIVTLLEVEWSTSHDVIKDLHKPSPSTTMDFRGGDS